MNKTQKRAQKSLERPEEGQELSFSPGGPEFEFGRTKSFVTKTKIVLTTCFKKNMDDKRNEFG